ncbi:cadherin-like domain-containing protein [Microbacteriaceae bacterium VKM Ac-2855]|nr:cadherin-like domain-containing protein [Microbacteriaceae bacterium VKM Ac-2855]
MAFTRVSRRPRTIASVATLAAVSIVVSTMAVLYQGVTTADVDLNDGGVWVTKPAGLLAGRVNYPSQVFDAGLRTKAAEFDIDQVADTVVVHDEINATVSVVDTANVALGAEVAVPGLSTVTLGGDVLALLDRESGRLWATTAESVESFDVASTEPVATLGAGAAMTVAGDGTVFAASREQASLVTIAPDGTVSSKALGGFGASAELNVTAVGAVPVVYDSASGALSIDAREAQPLPADVAGDPGAIRLQSPGPAAGSLSYSDDTALVLQPLDGSAPTRISSEGAGTAVAPVVVGGCSYAAWTGSGKYLRDCAGTVDDDARDVASLLGDARAVFRVNRAAVVLNELGTGKVWLVDQDMKELQNWDDITPSDDETTDDEDQESSEQRVETTIPERTADNRLPVAVDDELGVRAGRTIILPVLDNDSDPDGDVLTAERVGDDPAIGEIVSISGGAALQIRVDPEAVGSAIFRYAVADGRQGVAEATVTLSVVPPERNSPPVQKREATIVVEQGASLSYNVLPDFTDPDGDDLYLESAAPTTDDQVRSRPDGLVTFDAVGAQQGRKDVLLSVSDGTEPVDGVLRVDVRAPGVNDPIANADHVITVVDQPVIVAPLTNDLSPSGVPLTLTDVDDVSGATVVPDYTAGTFTFTAAAEGSYYAQYRVNDGPRVAVGLVRIDVLPGDATAAEPVAVRDVALLPVGGDVLVDVLQNDSDPAGGVLVVQEVTVSPTLGVAVAVLDHAVLRITDQPGITEPVTFSYTVSNGTATAPGEVLVIPVPAPPSAGPPVAVDDTAVVRAGDVVTLDVLANDSSPSGATLHVAADLVEPVPAEADGQAFISEDRVRFLAGPEPKTVYLTYEAIDPLGQKDAGYVSIQILPADAGNTPPRPQDLDARALAGTTIRIPVPLTGIDQDGDSVTLVGQAEAPKLGRIDEVGDGFLSYEAYADSAGTDTFTYRVRDSLGAENTATIRVGVAPASLQNQTPNAVKDTVIALPGRRIAVDVLGNDTDPDGDTLSLATDGLVLDEGITAEIAGGRVLVTAPETEGDYTLQYTVTDARGATAVGSLLVTVSADAPLQPPIARDDVVTVAATDDTTTVDVAVLKNDEDRDGVAAELTITVEAAAASVSDSAVTVELAETAQIIRYTVTDPDGLTGSAFIRVPGLADLVPSLKDDVDAVEVTSGETVTILIADYVDSPSGKPLRITQADKVSATHAADAAFVQDEGTLVYTPAAGYFGPDALSFEVTDGEGPDDPAGAKATIVLPITVLPASNQPPTMTDGAMQVAPGEAAATLDLRALSADPDPGDLEKLSYQVSAAPDGFTAAVNGSVLSVSAEEDVSKGTTETLTITLTDGTNPAVTASVVVAVTASTRPLTVANDDVVAKAPQGRAVTVDVLSNDVNPYPESPLEFVGQPEVTTPGAGDVQASGRSLVITPAASFVGTMTVRYRVADATEDPDRYVYGSVLVTVQGKPAAPGTPSVSSVQDRTVVLSWPDGPNNGAEITGHTVRWSGGSQGCPATTCTIGGLTNDVEYVFTVTASNEVGESDPSPASAIARPDARPGAPTITALDFGDGSLTVTWADGPNPGSAVTGYTVQLVGEGGGEFPVAAGTRTRQFSGLSNGSNYTLKVRASNKAPDPSDWSGPMSMSPAGAPSAPGTPIVSPAKPVGAQSQLTVTWTAPAVPNAEALSGYTVQVKRSGTVVSTADTDSKTLTAAVTVDNSENGYTFAVTAKNKATDAGKSAPVWSADSAPRRAVGTPGTPVITSAAEGDNSIVRFAWTPGTANGLSASETRYVYDLNGDESRRPASATLTQGISNNNTYTVRVKAVATVEGNEYESAWSSPSSPLAPFGPVQTPVARAAQNGTSVTLSWAPPAANGRPLDRLEIMVDNGSWQRVDPTNGSTSAGNGYSETHSIRVKAFDTAGQVSAESYAEARTVDPPPKEASVRKSSENGPCQSGNCPFVIVDTKNFPEGDYQYKCLANGAVFAEPPTTGRTRFYANGSTQLGCYYGFKANISVEIIGVMTTSSTAW